MGAHGGDFRVQRSRAANQTPCIFDAANEIANNLDLIGVIRDFNVGELIFNQEQQFQTIKPNDSEIATEVRFVLDATDVDAEMFGDKRANVQAFPRRYLWSAAQAPHGDLPNHGPTSIRSSNLRHHVALSR
jgi:hypothetical protein